MTCFVVFEAVQCEHQLLIAFEPERAHLGPVAVCLDLEEVGRVRVHLDGIHERIGTQ